MQSPTSSTCSKISSETRKDDRDAVERPDLRPVRPRDHLQSPRAVPAAPGRGAALLQRTARLLCAQPLRGHRTHAVESRDLHLPSRRDARHAEVGHGDPARHVDLRGSAQPWGLPVAALSDVHAATDRCARARDPPAVHKAAGSARGCGRLRLRRRPGLAGADARHRLAARHPRRRPGGSARSLPGPAVGRRSPRRHHPRRCHLRRLHRLARRASV